MTLAIAARAAAHWYQMTGAGDLDKCIGQHR